MTDSLDTDALNFDTEALDPLEVSQADLEQYAPRTVEELNDSLPQYEFIELLAVGGMGAIYKALQPKLDRLIAVKLLPKMVNDKYGFADRFAQEAKAMAKLSHPHIVPIFDFGETDKGQAYFVMEFVEGADLLRYLHGGQLTLAHFFGWIPQVCSAIQYAHNHDIVHRDIKPANILIDKEGNVKMADFGLAKLTGALPVRDPEDENYEQKESDDAVSMGTPGYAAPEQFGSDAQVDSRADIYSLGVVMYQMLTGGMPVGAFPMPSEVNPHVDIRVDEVVMRAMQQDAEDRFSSISEISERLAIIHATENELPKETEPEIEPPAPPSGKRLITGAVKTISARAPATSGRISKVSGKVAIPTDRVASAGKAVSLKTGRVAKMPTNTATAQPSAVLRQAMAKRDSSTPIWAVFAVVAVIIGVVYVVAFSGKKTDEESNKNTDSISSSSYGEPTATEKPIANPNTEAGKRIEKIVIELEKKYDPEVNIPHEESISNLNDLYAKTLETEKADATDKENPKLVTALQAEIERTPKGEAPGDTDDSNLHKKILKMISNYHRKLKSLEEEKAQNIQELELQLDDLLDTLQKDYSLAENRSAALDVENYRRKRKEWQSFIRKQSQATE